MSSEPAPELPRASRSAAFFFGSVQSLGYRALPLVRVYLSRRLSIDADASVGVELDGHLRDRYLAGFTWAF